MKTRNIIYLDTAATTSVDPEVSSTIIEHLGDQASYANPSSIQHLPGQAAADIVALARAEVATELGCEADEIVFTSGATEANNLALRGVALANAKHGRHLVTSSIEHKAVLECCSSLQRDGFEVTYLQPNSKGWVEPEAVERALRPDTLLLSLMHTNNETGMQQPILEVADVAAQAGVLFHVDAAQAAGKFPINLAEIPIDLLSLSAHKFHGPKGIGCLVIRNRRQLRLQPLLYGGGQEFGIRSGTLPTHQIVGLSKALKLAANRRDKDLVKVTELKHFFIQLLKEKLPVQVHGQLENASPYIVNLSISGIHSDALINQLVNEIAIASGSACSSGTIEPSYVLRAMGIEGDPLYGAVRISFDRNHSHQDISMAVEQIVAAVRRMQELESQ